MNPDVLTRVLTPYILDRSSAHMPAVGPNAHLPYGLWVCPDGWQVLHDRNYVPQWARAGDGSPAVPVSLLPCGHGRWVEAALWGYFFADGEQAFLTASKRRSSKARRLAVAHGERILEDFCLGRPVWRYIVPGGAGVPTGVAHWRG